MDGKVSAYVGFCLKARKIVLGSGSVDCLKKGVYLVLVCSSASDNTKKVAEKFKNRFSCPMVICKNGLENLVHKSGCKVAAVTDRELAGAIIKNLDENYELYTERF